MLQMDVGDPVYVVVIVIVVIIVIIIFEGGNETDASPVEALPHFV